MILSDLRRDHYPIDLRRVLQIAINFSSYSNTRFDLGYENDRQLNRFMDAYQATQFRDIRVELKPV